MRILYLLLVSFLLSSSWVQSQCTEPVVSSGLNTSVCSGINIGLVLNTSSQVTAVSYNIISLVVAPDLTPGPNNAIWPTIGVNANFLSIDSYTNLTNASKSVVYNVAPVSAAGCVGATKSITVNIEPEPVIASTLDKTVCSSSTIDLILSTSPTSQTAANYTIISREVSLSLTPSSGNVFLPANGVPANYLANDTYINITSTPQSVTYIVGSISASGCQGAIKAITVVINPIPSLPSTLSKTICSSAQSDLILSTSPFSTPAANYNIISRTVDPDLTPIPNNATWPAVGVNSNFLANDTYINLTNTSKSVVYDIAPVGVSGCIGASKSITVNIEPEPVMANTLDKTICSSTKTDLILSTSSTSIAAASYSITSAIMDNGLIADANNSIVPATAVNSNYLSNDKFRNVSATPLNVSYTVEAISVTGCLGSQKVAVISILPEPVISTTLDKIICNSDVTGLVLASNPSSVSATSYSISEINIPIGLNASATNAIVPISSVGSNYLANDKFENLSESVLSVNYKIIPYSSNGCLGAIKEVLIEVVPFLQKPVINSTLLNSGFYELSSNIQSNNQWYFNGAKIQSGTNKTYLATESGSYKVQQELKSCKGEISELIALVVTGDIVQSNYSGFELYPNPSKEILILKNNHHQQHPTIEIEIYNLMGQIIKAKSTSFDEFYRVDTNEFLPGQYIIRAKVENNYSSLKFLKIE